MEVYVYKITNEITGKSYIGVSKNIGRRFVQHCRGRKNSVSAVHEAILKYGEENFECEPLAVVGSYKAAYNLENALVEKLNTISPNGYNLTAGGEGISNPSKEVRGKISKSLKALPPRKGVPHTDAAKKKMSRSHKGKKLSPEHRAKISASVKKIVIPDEQRKRMGEAQRGKRLPPEQRAKISAKLKGRKLSDETRRRMSEGQKRRQASLRSV